jgi:hypothetical protein
VLRRLLARFGELDGPGALLAGIHLEKAGTVKAAHEAIADAADREFLVAGTHKGLSHPFAAAIVVDGVDIIIPRDQVTLEQGLATAGRQIPPAFRGPAFGVLVADGDADAARSIIAQAEIGCGRTCRGDERDRHHDAEQKRARQQVRTSDGKRRLAHFQPGFHVKVIRRQ